MGKGPAGKSAEEFRAAHDKSVIVPQRIQAALDQLGDSWEYEAEFIKRCGGISQPDFARFRDKFAGHFFEQRMHGKGVKRVWCGTKKLAKELEEFGNR